MATAAIHMVLERDTVDMHCETLGCTGKELDLLINGTWMVVATRGVEIDREIYCVTELKNKTRIKPKPAPAGYVHPQVALPDTTLHGRQTMVVAVHHLSPWPPNNLGREPRPSPIDKVPIHCVAAFDVVDEEASQHASAVCTVGLAKACAIELAPEQMWVQDAHVGPRETIGALGGSFGSVQPLSVCGAACRCVEAVPPIPKRKSAGCD